MKGYLIYDKEGFLRNSWFAKSLIAKAKENNLELQLKIIEDCDFKKVPLPQFVIMRAIAPHLNTYFESKGIRVFNNSTTSKIANDKWATYEYAKDLGIKTMDTYLAQDLTEHRDKLGYPYIIKSLSGHGGKEVFMVKSDKEADDTIKKLGEKCILQKCSDVVGKDVRVYVLGKDILIAILRESNIDFRSNYSLGGKCCVFIPTSKMKEMVKRIATSLDCDFVGIDFIMHNGEWVLNEIEDIVGTRMIYKLTDIDVAHCYINYITRILNKDLY